MKDLYFRYNPEPSKKLLERGQIVEGSYFLVDKGFVHLSDDETIPCEFEVAHMQTGICWAVVYCLFLDSIDNDLVEGKYQLESKIKKAKRLTGTDKLFECNIEVSLSSCIEWKGGMLANNGLRFVFTVQSYLAERIVDIEDRFNKTIFCLSNLPISNSYHPNNITESEQAATIAAIQKVIETFSRDNTSVEELLKLGLEQASIAKSNNLSNTTTVYWRSIPFKINEQQVAELYWKHKLEDRQYVCQPLASLQINQNNIPPGWSIIEIAEWICNLLSLGVGRMVTWNYYYVPPQEWNQLPSKEYWCSRITQTANFVALTEERGNLSIHGLDGTSYAIKLVEQALSYIFRKPADDNIAYRYALTDYVYYASATSNLQHRCTLLCALVESIFLEWQKLANTDTAIAKSRKKKILDTIQNGLEESINELLPQVVDETDKDYQERCKKFLNTMRSKIGNSLSISYKDRLKSLFQNNGWGIDTNISMLGDISDRIEMFVDSRNKLFHEHRFFYDDPANIPDETERSQKLLTEIQNIEIFIPLLFATLFQYQGRYWDIENWAWMLTKE